MFSSTQLKDYFEKKYSRNDWLDILRENLGAKELYKNPKAVTLKKDSGGRKLAEHYYTLGKLTTQEGREIGIYEIPLTEGVKIERNKVGLRELLKEVYQNDVDAAFIVFEQADKWRFSYVSEIAVYNKETKKREKKKTDPKRFTYLMGKGERCKTAADRFARIRTSEDLFGKAITLDALEDAFNVEKMSKAFFNEYRKQYGYFVAYLTGKDENNKEVGAAHAFLKSIFNGDEKRPVIL